MRRWPQRGFSRASRSTTARTSAGTGGRPRGPDDWRHWRRTSARCQRNSVRGVTRRAPHEERGRWRVPAAISGAKLWARDLAAQNLELVAQHEQLDVLYIQATATANQCAK